MIFKSYLASAESMSQLRIFSLGILRIVTEEDIKIKYVLPWLKQTGVELHEIQLEHSFSLKIGRQTIPIGQTARKRDSVGGRLDILVQRNGRNLLIVETKADGFLLTDDDRDQAISYARLVHPMAPYAVVTNGCEYKLYDFVTKSQINPNEIQIRGFNAVLPDDDILEAQSLFLALNPENLMAFCRSQVISELRIVKGSLADNKKYVPELHVPRDSISQEITAFYRSPLPGLLISGQSGSGKTCEMCWIAENLLDSGKPVLFFNGIALEAGILEAISAEFSWTFNSSDLPVQVVRRMAKLAGIGGLSIVIDAIDEWMHPSRENNLGSLLRAAENNNVKIILSCKTSATNRFISARGNPTNIDLLTKKIEIGEFSDKEFYLAVEKYRQEYRFFGGFEDAVLDEARSNPFMLRVLFDVASGSNLRHITFSSAEFFETYFHRVIFRTVDIRQAERTLKVIASLLYQHNVDWIDEEIVRTSLDLKVSDPILEELFEYEILLRNKANSGAAELGFYFQQLRDYIIAFKSCQFNAMSRQQLINEFDSITTLSPRSEVFSLYYRLASLEHKKVLDREVRENASLYLRTYTSIINKHFPKLRTTFKPKSEGRVGFIGELHLVNRRLGLYGFRPLGETDDEIHFVPIQRTIGESNLSYLDGADQLHLTSGARGFRDGMNVLAEVIDHELLPQIDNFLNEGSLNESQCPDMLLEFIVESILRNKQIFAELIDANGEFIKYPIDIKTILNFILREKLIRHFRDDLIATKRRNGDIEEIWDGGFVSYSVRLTVEDERKIVDAVENSLSSGCQPCFRITYTELEALECSLVKAINQLLPTQTSIEDPLYKGESGLKARVYKGQPFPSENAKGYIKWLYSAFLENYKRIIETNFPTLKEYFPLYSELPVQVHLVLGNTVKHGFGRDRTSLDEYSSPSQSGELEVEVVDNLILSLVDNSSISIGGEVFQTSYWCQRNFESLFFGTSGRTNDPFKGMVLRRLVYERVNNEWKSVKKRIHPLLE